MVFRAAPTWWPSITSSPIRTPAECGGYKALQGPTLWWRIRCSSTMGSTPTRARWGWAILPGRTRFLWPRPTPVQTERGVRWMTTLAACCFKPVLQPSIEASHNMLRQMASQSRLRQSQDLQVRPLILDGASSEARSL